MYLILKLRVIEPTKLFKHIDVMIKAVSDLKHLFVLLRFIKFEKNLGRFNKFHES